MCAISKNNNVRKTFVDVSASKVKKTKVAMLKKFVAKVGNDIEIKAPLKGKYLSSK